MDIALNPTGLRQARAAADLLMHRGITEIVASPLSRARDTAMIVAEKLGLPVEYDEGLREVSYGTHEGEPMTEWFHEWVAGRYTPEGAQSFPLLRERARGAINRALTRAAPVLVVAHGALFRAVRAEMGLDPDVRTANAMPYFCEPGRPSWTLTAATREA